MNFLVAQQIIAAVVGIPVATVRPCKELLLQTLVSSAPGLTTTPNRTTFRGIVGTWTPRRGYRPRHLAPTADCPTIGDQLMSIAADSSREAWALLRVSNTFNGRTETTYYVVSMVDGIHAHAENLAFASLPY